MIMILLRTVIIYIFLVAVMRLSGKRQIGELQLSELITAFLLSELAASPITNSNVPIIYAFVPILALICLEIINTFVVTKCPLLKRFFVGTPSFIIKKGVLDQKELSRIRLSLDELIAELRLKDISDISDVEYAILEQNGQLSVFPKTASRAVTVGDLSLIMPDKGIAHPLVFDGTICRNNLQIVNKSEAWLLTRIEKSGCTLKETFLYSLDDEENEYIIRRTV